MKDLIDNLIRDITKVGFMSKSEARRRIEEILQKAREDAFIDGQIEVYEKWMDIIKERSKKLLKRL